MANMYNILSDIEQTMFLDAGLKYRVQYRGENIWIVYVEIPNGLQNAKLEFLVDRHPNNPDDTDVAGSILRYGSVPPYMVERIADRITDRL
jgi:hypothetical protein